MSKLPETNDDSSKGPDHGSAPSTPRWVKVFGVGLVLVPVFVIRTHRQ